MRAALFLGITAGLLAASPVREAVERRQPQILKEFAEFLSVPNIASDRVNIQRNAELLRRMMERRGILVRLLPGAGEQPVVYGELPAADAKRTVVFYAHYDGQPVENSEWAGGNPFQPRLLSAPLEKDGRVLPLPRTGERVDPEWRLYGRSTSDDKAAIIAMLSALDVLQDQKIPLTSNVKFVFEGEEEAGSRHLEGALKRNAVALTSDVWFICDGPVHQTRQQQIYFGARGVVGFDLTVFGPRRELHSGHYGNWAPNPAMMLARLLASMKDDDGRVLIPNFYDGIVKFTDSEKKALAEAPDSDAELRKELWLARTDGGARKLIDLINEPSLNIRGLQSVDVGKKARNVIPSKAIASIDIRLVKGITVQDATDRLMKHIRKQGYYLANKEPDEATRLSHPKIAMLTTEGGYNAERTPMDLPISQEVIAALEKARGPIVRLPTLGGSVPLYMIENVLHVPMIGIPIANHDNSQHSSNENIRLQNLWDGIETMAALMTMAESGENR